MLHVTEYAAYTEISWDFLTDFTQALLYNNMAIWAQTSFHRIGDEYF